MNGYCRFRYYGYVRHQSSFVCNSIIDFVSDCIIRRTARPLLPSLLVKKEFIAYSLPDLAKSAGLLPLSFLFPIPKLPNILLQSLSCSQLCVKIAEDYREDRLSLNGVLWSFVKSLDFFIVRYSRGSIDCIYLKCGPLPTFIMSISRREEMTSYDAMLLDIWGRMIKQTVPIPPSAAPSISILRSFPSFFWSYLLSWCRCGFLRFLRSTDQPGDRCQVSLRWRFPKTLHTDGLDTVRFLAPSISSPIPSPPSLWGRRGAAQDWGPFFSIVLFMLLWPIVPLLVAGLLAK